MAFYQILQNIMDEKGMKIPDVARASGLSDSTIRSILTRKSNSVALEVAVKISRGLGISLEQLNGDDNSEKRKNGVVLTPTELDIVRKYRKLDARGQSSVLDTLDREYSYIDKKDGQMAAVVEDISNTIGALPSNSVLNGKSDSKK